MNVSRADLTSPLAKKIYNLKFDSQMEMLSGNYRKSINARKELAKIGVDNFELVTKVKPPLAGYSFSLFSKYGIRIFIAMIIEMLRIKSPDEKKFITMSREFKKGRLKV